MLKKNAIANLLGKSVSGICTFAFVPLYLKILGPEGYGLISLAATVQVIVFIVDLGFSGALTREIARLSTDFTARGTMRDLCRTFELLFWLGAALIAAGVVLTSPFAARHWLHPEHLTMHMVEVCLMLMGVNAGLQFPFLLYQGGLNGLQQQIPLNIVVTTSALLRGAGGVAFVLFVRHSVDGFFIWQILTSIAQVAVAAILTWRYLPHADTLPTVRACMLKPLWRFAIGMAGISITGIVLMQLDKVVLSKMVSLRDLGYYTLSALPGTVPILIGTAIQSAVYPRMNQLLVENDLPGLVAIYRSASQMVAIPAVSIGLLFGFFPREVMLLWTRNNLTADNTQMLVRLLVIGSALAGLMLIPYTLQLVFGLTRLILLFNCASVVVLLPAMILLVRSVGPRGAAYVSVALYLGQVVILFPLMHRQSLRAEMRYWYLQTLVRPILVAGPIMLVARNLIPPGIARMPLAATLIVLLAATMLATLLTMHEAKSVVRSWLWRRLA